MRNDSRQTDKLLAVPTQPGLKLACSIFASIHTNNILLRIRMCIFASCLCADYVHASYAGADEACMAHHHVLRFL